MSTCLPDSSSSRAARAFSSMLQVRRRSLGCPPWRGRRVLPRARAAASSSSFRPALASVVPSNPRTWLSCSSGEWVRIARQDDAAGVERGQGAEALLVDGGTGAGGQGTEVRAVGGGHRADIAHPVPARQAKLSSEFCPASKTTVMSAPPPAAAVIASYWLRSWLIIVVNWVTSGRSPSSEEHTS